VGPSKHNCLRIVFLLNWRWLHISAVLGHLQVKLIYQQTKKRKYTYMWDKARGVQRDLVEHHEPCLTYTACHRRNGPNFGRVFLMLNYTDITQNTYIQSWTVTEIMARENCGHLAFPRTVRLQLCSALTVREQCGTHFCDGTSSAQRDKIAFYYCWYVQCLVTPRTTVTWVRVFL